MENKARSPKYKTPSRKKKITNATYLQSISCKPPKPKTKKRLQKAKAEMTTKAQTSSARRKKESAKIQK